MRSKRRRNQVVSRIGNGPFEPGEQVLDEWTCQTVKVAQQGVKAVICRYGKAGIFYPTIPLKSICSARSMLVASGSMLHTLRSEKVFSTIEIAKVISHAVGEVGLQDILTDGAMKIAKAKGNEYLRGMLDKIYVAVLDNLESEKGH